MSAFTHATAVHVAASSLMWHHDHVWSAEASALGFPPGRWPHRMTADIGNRQLLVLERFERDADGEIIVAHYRQEYGVVCVRVLND